MKNVNWIWDDVIIMIMLNKKLRARSIGGKFVKSLVCHINHIYADMTSLIMELLQHDMSSLQILDRHASQARLGE